MKVFLVGGGDAWIEDLADAMASKTDVKRLKHADLFHTAGAMPGSFTGWLELAEVLRPKWLEVRNDEKPDIIHCFDALAALIFTGLPKTLLSLQETIVAREDAIGELEVLFETHKALRAACLAVSGLVVYDPVQRERVWHSLTKKTSPLVLSKPEGLSRERLRAEHFKIYHQASQNRLPYVNAAHAFVQAEVHQAWRNFGAARKRGLEAAASWCAQVLSPGQTLVLGAVSSEVNALERSGHSVLAHSFFENMEAGFQHFPSEMILLPPDTFDHAVLIAGPEFVPYPSITLPELSRVVRHRIVLGFGSRESIEGRFHVFESEDAILNFVRKNTGFQIVETQTRDGLFLVCAQKEGGEPIYGCMD